MSNVHNDIGQKGQTSVEYILIICVITAILFVIMAQLKQYLIADAGMCTESSTSIVCSINRTLSIEGFRRFQVYR